MTPADEVTRLISVLERQRASFLRDQVAQQGTAAITRFGLTDTMHERQRRLEPFAIAHRAADDSGTY